MTPVSPAPPDDIEALARERAASRTVGDYALADSLRARIESSGWRVVDRGTSFRLEPAAQPTIEEAGIVRYGSAGAVPTVPDGPATTRFTVLLIADDWPDDTARMLRGLRAHAPVGTPVVIVANDPAPEQAARLVAGSEDLEPVTGSQPEVLWTSARLGCASALNVGLRRARGSVVILADTSVEITGDAFEPVATALGDRGLAVTGGFGLAVPDLRHVAPADGPDVDAIAAGWLAFRREDLAALGPLDEKFAVDAYLDAWWSLVLRAGPESARAARRAVRLDLPLVRHEPRGVAALPAAERDRLAKRNSYRLLDRFRHRADLLSATQAGREAR